VGSIPAGRTSITKEVAEGCLFFICALQMRASNPAPPFCTPRPFAVKRFSQRVGLKEIIMRVSEILRIKGNILFTTTPDGLVLEAVQAMAEHDVGSKVVMDHGKMVGMLTFREVLAALAKTGGALGDLRVRDVMQHDPFVATPDMEVMELRRSMLEKHARYIPVMEGTTLQGVISFHDVAKAVYEEQSFENKMLKGYIKNWPDEETV
jgi:CBS domain-containing protein